MLRETITMPKERRDSPAITTRFFDISLYSVLASGEADTKIFEGRTTSLSRAGFKALVNEIGNPFDHGQDNEIESYRDWIEHRVVTQFHAITPVLDEVNGTIVEVEESSDARFRWLLEVQFESELNLLKLQL